MTCRFWTNFLRDEAGNLTSMFALTLLPVLGLVGITVDYTQSATRKVTLDSIADAASLAAVTPVLLSQTDQASINVATTLFNSQASLVKGIGAVTLTVTASDNGLTRTVNVTYQTVPSAMW
jgi:Flp pilus assembly protein TadG